MKTEILAVCVMVILLGSFFHNSDSSKKFYGIIMNKLPYLENFYIENVPYKYQNDFYWCGPASLAMVLDYWGDYVTQENIASLIYRPDENVTYSSDMVEYAENQGFIAFWRIATIEELKENISNGYPIIVLQRFSLDSSENHFRVVVGYDERNVITYNPVYLRDSSIYLDYPDYFAQDYYIPYDNFLELWRLDNNLENVSIVIYPAPTLVRDTIPPTVSIISPSANEILDNDWIEVSWEGQDRESGIERYEVKMDNLDWNPTVSTSKQFHASNGNHIVYLRAIDRAGNSTEDNFNFTIDIRTWIDYIPLTFWIFVIGLVLFSLFRKRISRPHREY